MKKNEKNAQNNTINPTGVKPGVVLAQGGCLSGVFKSFDEK